jgi:hypothetical protein
MEANLARLTLVVGQAMASGQVAANTLTAAIASGSEVTLYLHSLTNSGRRYSSIPADDDK